MPRPPRADEAGALYHALNRGNNRRQMFRKAEDYAAFERVVVEGLEKYPVDLMSYQWMPNHWHMVLRPKENGAMGRFLYWVSMTHSARHHAHYHTTGRGHLYQGRFKSFPVQDDDHFLVVCRYVERNALAAGLVTRAEAWKWGSLWNWCGNRSEIALASWPIPRPPRWVERANQSLGDQEQKKLQRSLRCGCPFGDTNWVQSTAERLGLGSTLRRQGRPRRFT